MGATLFDSGGTFQTAFRDAAPAHGLRAEQRRAARPSGNDGPPTCARGPRYTGIAQPLAAIGEACRETGAVFLADCVLSLGGCEVSGGAWSFDVAVGGLQKCLCGPPGLALGTLSARAQTAIANRREPIHSGY